MIRILIAAAAGAALLVLGLAAWATADPISVPLPLSVTLPAPVPPPFTTAVNQQVTISGVNYTCTGTLTFTPVAVMAREPSISGFRDASRNWLPGDGAAAVTSGSSLFVEGSGFGQASGTVILAGVAPAAVTSWSDAEIAITVPSPMSSSPITPPPVTLSVRRPDGCWATTLAFRVNEKTPGEDARGK